MTKKICTRKPQTNDVYVIRCECGEEIVVVPDLKLMKEVIDNHLMQHHQITLSGSQKSLENQQVRKDLVEGVVERIVFAN
jgi:hypothetical protein